MTDTTPPLIWGMTLIFIVLELAFQLSDRGMLPWDDLRLQSWFVLAFLDVEFDAALAGESTRATLWTSMVTYAFLHGGLVHLLMNGVIFLSLGGPLLKTLGTAKFLILFAATAVGGAVAFGLIAETRAALVGASGVLFGFIGALKAWEWRYLKTYNMAKDRFWRTIAGLVVLNLVLFFMFPGGGLAWEAHLGGFIAGFALAPILAPKAMGPAPF